MGETTQHARWRHALQPLFKPTGQNYETDLRRYKELRGVFHQELARASTECIRRGLKDLPRRTYIEKEAAAIWVNQHLESLGLGILSWQTDRPARLVVERTGGADEQGHFMLEVIDHDGRRLRTTPTRGTSPILDLIWDDPAAGPPSAAWEKRANRHAGPGR
jgi:hypothetical protein